MTTTLTGTPNAAPNNLELHGLESGCTASKHGTRVAYDTYHCRCPDARAKSTRARKARKLRQERGGAGLIDGTGTVRRIRALCRNGWTLEALAVELGGCTWQRVAHLRCGRNPLVSERTHLAIVALYQRLSDVAGASMRAAAHAERQGWLGPLWWDDDTIDNPMVVVKNGHVGQQERFSEFTNDFIDPIAVERFVNGDDTVHLTKAEKACAYKEMTARRVPRNEIVRRLRISWSTAREFAELARGVGGRADDRDVSEVAS